MKSINKIMQEEVNKYEDQYWLDQRRAKDKQNVNRASVDGEGLQSRDLDYQDRLYLVDQFSSVSLHFFCCPTWFDLFLSYAPRRSHQSHPFSSLHSKSHISKSVYGNLSLDNRSMT